MLFVSRMRRTVTPKLVPPKLIPWTDFGKKLLKVVPPCQKQSPQGGPNLTNICLSKLVPQAKLRVYTHAAHACALIMYTS